VNAMRACLHARRSVGDGRELKDTGLAMQL